MDGNLARVAAVVGDGVGRLAVNVHHHADQLTAHVAGRAHVSHEAPEALGTAGAVAHLRDWLDGRPVLVVNGDTWSTSGTSSTGHRTFGRRVERGRSRDPAPAPSTSAARLSGMETRRWTNPTQPQTLQIAVFLLYANAVLGLLLGNTVEVAFGFIIGLAALVAFAVAGFGIANEKRWGYNLGIGVSALETLSIVKLIFDSGDALGFSISLMFAIAVVALLLHPQSRDYQQIWFN